MYILLYNIYPIYVLLLFQKHNSNRKKQVILSNIPNGEGRHYLTL